MDYAHTEEFEGFTVTLELLPEDTPPQDQFAGDPKQDAEIFRLIDAGILLWFCAKVTASREGVTLATDYLGGCCYESADQFVTGSDYFEDMRRTVVDEARATITKLAQSN